MALNDAGKNAILDGGIDAITHLSLHTNAVGSGAGGEVAGGSPAYARKAAAWGAAVAGSAALTTQPVFDVPATTVARVGFWTAASGGTFLGDAEVTDEVFAAQGTYTVTSGSIGITG